MVARSLRWGVGLGAAAVLAACARPPAVRVPRVVPVAVALDAAVAAPDAAVAPASRAADELCARPVEGVGAALPGARPFTPPAVRCPEDDAFCDTVGDPPPGADRCFVANANIARAEAEIRAGTRRPPRASQAWDGATPPSHLDRVEAHLHLAERERRVLRAQRFVVLDRLAHTSYASAYHAIFQQQLPVFVSTDSILHAVFKGHGAILESVERERLRPTLRRMLRRLREALLATRASHAPDTLRDLDVYLAVARALLDGPPDDGGALSLFGHDEEVRALVAGVASRELTAVALFGRARMVDFSQYEPRGHYAGSGGAGDSLGRYFQAVTWLSRLEFNLVSRDSRSSQPGMTPDPRETPREALDALALANLVERAGVLPSLAAFERVYATFGGAREDVPVPALLALRRSVGDPRAPGAFGRLRAAIGTGYVRTARVHFMPEGVTALPVIATLLGPRIVPDVAPLTALVHDSVPGRTDLGAADVGYVLGHDRAAYHLRDDLASFPTLRGRLDAARASLREGAARAGDVYGRWLSAVLALAALPRGVAPSFTRSEGYADLRLGSALVGYGQIRHNYVLLAGQGYDAYGCEIPDGYVEPALEVYDALLAYARAARGIDPSRRAYFDRVARVLGTLREIVATERSGAALSDAQTRWLGMVAEVIPAGGYGGESGEPPKYTGWYFDLFPDREIGALADAGFVADWFTLTNAGRVRYLGAEGPRMGVFVVDVNGAPRAMVGPIARGYELAGPIAARYTDETVREAGGRVAPWQASYVAEAPAAPAIEYDTVSCADRTLVVVASPAALGPVDVTLLDHHGDAITAPVTRDVGAAGAVFAFAPPADVPPEGVHLRVRDLAGGGPYDLVGGSHLHARGDED